VKKLVLILIMLAVLCISPSCSSDGNGEGETEPEVLLSDDFSDSTSGWEEYDLGVEGTAAYDGGQLKLKNYASDELSTSSLLLQSFSDFELEVDTKLVSGTDDNWHQIAFRADDEGNGYDFGVSADGYFYVAKWVNEEAVIIKAITASGHINTGQGETNTMGVRCEGNVIKVSVNGHLLTSVTDSTYTSGYLGLSCSCGEGGTFSEIVFDNLEVKSV